MSDLTRDAAWVLTGAFTLSIVYELYRAIARAGASQHDSLRGFLAQLPQYALATAVIAALFLDAEWAAWAGLVMCAIAITVSIAYYNPRIMVERRPGHLDWFEDLVFTGLLFVAATQLLYEVA